MLVHSPSRSSANTLVDPLASHTTFMVHTVSLLTSLDIFCISFLLQRHTLPVQCALMMFLNPCSTSQGKPQPLPPACIRAYLSSSQSAQYFQKRQLQWGYTLLMPLRLAITLSLASSHISQLAGASSVWIITSKLSTPRPNSLSICSVMYLALALRSSLKKELADQAYLVNDSIILSVTLAPVVLSKPKPLPKAASCLSETVLAQAIAMMAASSSGVCMCECVCQNLSQSKARLPLFGRQGLATGGSGPGAAGRELVSPQIIFKTNSTWMFCCGGGDKSAGSEVVEGFNKVKTQDRKEFTLQASRHMGTSKMLVNRMSTSIPEFRSAVPQNSKDYQKLMQGQLSDYVKRKILKSNYEELLDKYRNSSEKWSDPDFMPLQESWGDSQGDVVWRRVSEVIPDARFVENNYSPADILQGRLGNCYFLSAVAGLAEKPYRVRKIFKDCNINKNGIYMARVLHKGVYQEVVVDDYFPCNSRGELLGAQPAGGKEIWVMVLEKCWAKMFGSYDAIDGGLPNEVLHAFSAAPTYNYRVPGDYECQEILWQKMVKADQNDQVICCGTRPDDLMSLGLVSGHAYTILGVYEYPTRVIKIRNPWGSLEWKGPANDSDRRFWSSVSAEDQLRMGYNVGDDGIFFMLWEDFLEYFIVVDICRLSDNAQYLYERNTFKPAKPISFEVSTEGGETFFSVAQPSKRELKVKKHKSQVKMATITLVLARKIDSEYEYEYVMSKGDYSYSDYNMKIGHLPAGEYVLLCFAEGGEENQVMATVSVYSEANVSIVSSQVDSDNVLSKTYLDHARNNDLNKQFMSQSPDEWVCFDVLTDNCGFGYSAFHLDDGSHRKLGLQFEEQEYKQNGMELIDENRGAGSFKVICEVGEETIVLCRLIPGQYISEFMMPTPRMFRLS